MKKLYQYLTKHYLTQVIVFTIILAIFSTLSMLKISYSGMIALCLIGFAFLFMLYLFIFKVKKIQGHEPKHAECKECGWYGKKKDLKGWYRCPNCYSGNIRIVN